MGSDNGRIWKSAILTPFIEVCEKKLLLESNVTAQTANRGRDNGWQG
jgi:hypothetical protein